jgi:hypothetical protein
VIDDGLVLPVFEVPHMPAKRVSASAYRDFVEFGWKNLPNRARVLKRRRSQEPTARFRLIDSDRDKGV